jgi:hypothetical protein
MANVGRHADLPMHPPPISSFHVVPESGVRIMINRSTPPVGHWDDPIDTVLPSDGALFTYTEVHIEKFEKHPHLVGRRALIEFDAVGMFVDA